MDLRELVGLLTEEEQQAVRPVVLQLLRTHSGTEGMGHAVSRAPARQHRLSFTGMLSADPDFAATAQEVLRREFGEPS